MEINFPKMDWLTVTGKYPSKGAVIDNFGVRDAISLARSTLDYFFLPSQQLEAARPDRFYAWSFKHSVTGMKFDVARKPWDQGWKLVLSGDALKHVPQTQHDFAQVVDESGYNVTRLDVAIDVFNSGYRTEDIWDEYKKLHPHEGKRSQSLIISPTGGTMYLGSRQSQKMLRIYDKGTQTGSGLDWLRFELELKREEASQGLFTLWDVGEVFYGTVANMLGIYPHPLMDELYRLAQYRMGMPVKQVETPSQAAYWWMKQVIPAFVKLCDNDPSLAGTVLEEFESAFMRGDGAASE